MHKNIRVPQEKRDKTAKGLRSATRKYFLPGEASVLFEAAVLQMPKSLNLTIVVSIGLVLVGCAEQSVIHKPIAAVEEANSHLGRMSNVRTTAYNHKEAGGRKNALGTYLSGRHVMSAAADWSRFPLGTRFRICSTREEFIIDDYGSALVGTNTIDLYKPTKLEMKRWGVRVVDIDILQWGSEQKSLEVLGPRAKHPQVQSMLVAMQKKTASRTVPAASSTAPSTKKGKKVASSASHSSAKSKQLSAKNSSSRTLD
jgi:3D (Asp-Asp-Asp) domain-containing protein